MQDLMLASPEVTILTMACVVLMVEVYRPDPEKQRVYRLSQGGLVAALFFTVISAPGGRSLAFNGVFVADVMSTVLKAAILLVTLMVFAYSKHYLTERKSMKAERLGFVCGAWDDDHRLRQQLPHHLLGAGVIVLIAVRDDRRGAG
ncbi:MAG: hypothetical protein ACREYF_22925, partial [Gammaproteobacteria bacterium]